MENIHAFDNDSDNEISFLVRYGHGPDGYRIFNDMAMSIARFSSLD